MTVGYIFSARYDLRRLLTMVLLAVEMMVGLEGRKDLQRQLVNGAGYLGRDNQCLEELEKAERCNGNRDDGRWRRRQIQRINVDGSSIATYYSGGNNGNGTPYHPHSHG